MANLSRCPLGTWEKRQRPFDEFRVTRRKMVGVSDAPEHGPAPDIDLTMTYININVIRHEYQADITSR